MRMERMPGELVEVSTVGPWDFEDFIHKKSV